jgi:Na+/H+-dicarboxylate symporter
MTKAKKQRLALHWQILIAIGVAVIAGLLAGEHAGLFGVTFYSVFDFLGRLFLNALKMLIVPAGEPCSSTPPPAWWPSCWACR